MSQTLIRKGPPPSPNWSFWWECDERPEGGRIRAGPFPRVARAHASAIRIQIAPILICTFDSAA